MPGETADHSDMRPNLDGSATRGRTSFGSQSDPRIHACEHNHRDQPDRDDGERGDGAVFVGAALRLAVEGGGERGEVEEL